MNKAEELLYKITEKKIKKLNKRVFEIEEKLSEVVTSLNELVEKEKPSKIGFASRILDDEKNTI